MLWGLLLEVHDTSDNPNLDNSVGRVYLIEDDGQYQILVDTPSGTFKKTAYSVDKTHKVGDEIVVK